MPLSESEIKQAAIARLALLVEEFGKLFAARAINDDETAAIDAIEGDWQKLREQTEQVYQKMVSELVNSVDERSMIAKKNRMAGARNNAEDGQDGFDNPLDHSGQSELRALYPAPHRQRATKQFGEYDRKQERRAA